MSAGCLFTDGKSVLCGLQKHGDRMVLSGFGGKIEEGESSTHCAIREMLEELFHFENVPETLINDIFVSYIPGQFIKNGDYSIMVYTFWELEDFLTMTKFSGCSSPLYDHMPTNITDLILKRKFCADAEIQALGLLPLSEDEYTISKAFLSDLKLLRPK